MVSMAQEIYTTIFDMLKWDRALYNRDFISQEDLDLMYSPTELNDGTQINYGFGWWIGERETIGKVVYHAGNSNGFETYFERHLDSNKTIIVLQNFDATTPAIKSIEAILYDKPLDFVVSRNEIELPVELLIELEGNYAINDDFVFNVYRKKQRLYVQLTGQSALEMFAESNKTFFAKKVDVQFEFIRNQNNKVIQMNVFQNGHKMEAIRK